MKPVCLLLIFIVTVVSGTSFRRFRRNANQEYKMCVAEELLQLCNEMAGQETKSSAKIVCIPARDRMECITKIKQREADFLAVDPEDMYVAKNEPEQDFALFEEIRTKEEPEAEFRYEAVAVIHKDLNINGMEGLKGLNSCHTGVGRNVGYKIPLTKLKQKGIIGNLAEPELSPRENELKAFSTLFSKACIVGKWSPDPKINLKLKRKYSNLCALCEHPDICDYPDLFSGYDGALRCLAHNGGQIAWTKVIFVRKFFGLPVGITPAKPTTEDPSKFAYLCPDGTKVPVTDTPCTWAARPWQGYMTNAAIAKSVDELRRKIENLNVIGSKNHADWLQKVLELNDKTAPKENKIISPEDYLNKANYTDVIERDYGPPFKTIRFCVTSKDEQDKCRTLSKVAFSRNIRPRFDCVLEANVQNCLKSIRDDGADIITLDAGLVDTAVNQFNLKPVVAEQYGPTGGSYYAVAVVKKDSSIRSFEDLRGKKSCHTGIGRTAGYNAPLFTLVTKGLIKEGECPYPKALANFFTAGSCLPGAKEDRLKLDVAVSEKLCSLCAGDLERNNQSAKCNFDQTESYSGYTGAFRCLVQGGGDVAFVKHVTVPGNTDGNNPEVWAKDLKSDNYELLCPNDGRAPVSEYAKCNLAHAPPHMVVTSNTKSDSLVDEIRNALLSISTEFTKRPDWFKLFGTYNGKKDLLFKDSATGLVSISGESEIQKDYSKLLAVVNACH
ncbi:transferrin [Anthonomus grandis grandis]|uniref:transferrin n=1 Tax=Anthonomus grandis grandis TaxID=2921223 RepID=UPI0021665232|nr:transferrin [Anthonomus grandis grandis]